MSNPQSHQLNAINQAFAWWSRLGLLVLTALYLYFKDIELASLEARILAGAPLLYFFATLLLTRSKVSEKEWISAVLLPMDGAMLGAIAAAGTTGPGAIFLALITLINSFTDTRRAQTSRAVLAFVSALVLVYFYLYPILDPTIGISSWIALGGFILFSGLHLLVFKLDQRNQLQRIQQMEQEHRELKLRNYQILKYLPATLRKSVARARDLEVKTQRKKITVFFSDVVGFSELAEQMEASELALLLNSYLTEMSEVADKYGGTVDKFMGDGIMIFFGDLESKGPRADAVACVGMAVEMRRRMNLLQVRWRDQGIDQNLHVRIGINSGYATVGNFGSHDRLDDTVLGTEVNLASRLESAAEPGEILISSSTFLLVQDRFACQDKGDIQVKGFSEPVRVFSVIDSHDSLHRSARFLNQVTEGFSIYLDLDNLPDTERPKVISLLEKTVNLIKRGN